MMLEAKWRSTSTVNVVLKLKRPLQCTMCTSYRKNTIYYADARHMLFKRSDPGLLDALARYRQLCNEGVQI